MGFAENLNYCMQQRGYSAYRLAKELGVNNQSTVNWQRGGILPHPKTRQKIADHFGITLAELDGDELPVLPRDDIKKDPIREDGAVSPAAQEIFDFIDSASGEELADVIKYIRYLKSQRERK